MMRFVAVIGGGAASAEELAISEAIGEGLANAGFGVVTGGLGGVMAAACRGARRADGLTLGLLPGDDPVAANPHVQVAIPTGMGEMRNALIVRTARIVIAVGGEYGTLSEIALALKTGKPVIGIGTWNIEGVRRAEDAADGVRQACALLQDVV